MQSRTGIVLGHGQYAVVSAMSRRIRITRPSHVHVVLHVPGDSATALLGFVPLLCSHCYALRTAWHCPADCGPLRLRAPAWPKGLPSPGAGALLAQLGLLRGRAGGGGAGRGARRAEWKGGGVGAAARRLRHFRRSDAVLLSPKVQHGFPCIHIYILEFLSR